MPNLIHATFQVLVLVLACSHLAYGAGGPQRRRVPTAAKLAHLRRQFLRNNEDTRVLRNIDHRQYDEEIDQDREGRNLANVFPFVGGNRGLPRARLFGEEPLDIHHNDHHDHHDHHDHQDHHDHHEHQDHHDHHDNHLAPFDPRVSRQRNGDEELALDIGSIAAAGERCIDKVVMVEETEFDDVVTCKHSYSEKCHTTYTTDFEPQQEEVCEENFIKECFIEYKKSASEESVEFCHTPLVCEGEGPTECRTVYESQCETRYVIKIR